MGAKCKVVIRGSISIDRIMDTLKRMDEVKEINLIKNSPNVYIKENVKIYDISIKLSDGMKITICSYMTSVLNEYPELVYYRKPSNILMVYPHSLAVNVLRKLVNKYGGYIDQNDCDNSGFKYIKGQEGKDEDYEADKIQQILRKIIKVTGLDNIEPMESKREMIAYNIYVSYKELGKIIK